MFCTWSSQKILKEGKLTTFKAIFKEKNVYWFEKAEPEKLETFCLDFGAHFYPTD